MTTHATPTERMTMTADPTADHRAQLLDALDFAYCQGLGYDSPEALVAAYDAACGVSVPPPADQTATLRAVVARIGQMADYWEQRLPEVIRTPAVVSAIRAALEPAEVLRRMAAEEQPAKPDRCPHGCDTSICPCLACAADEEQSAADEADVDLANGPVCCPLCPNTVTLHTPNGARAHFTVVHPEQRITGRGPGPWPLLVTDGDEAQPGTERPAVGEQPETQETRVVAYVLAVRTELHCLRCTPNRAGDIWTPVTSEELEDGGICTVCGVDVLIPQEANRG